MWLQLFSSAGDAVQLHHRNKYYLVPRESESQTSPKRYSYIKSNYHYAKKSAANVWLFPQISGITGELGGG